MNHLRSLVILLSAFACTGMVTALQAHEGATAGPNGGRILKHVQPTAEFFVTAERKVQITFMDAEGQPVAPDDALITVTTGQRSAPTTLTFSRDGSAFVSDQPLPTGNFLPTVVQIKVSPDAQTVTDRFNVNLSTCPECGHGEYACACHD